MKFFLLVCSLLFSFHANAGLKFSYSETPEYAKPKLIDLLEIQTELEDNGYFPVDLSHEQKLQGIGVDQMFFDSTTSKLILLKFGQRVSDSKVLGDLININGDFLYHGETADKAPYALYFIGHRSSEARAALKNLGIKNRFSFLTLILPEAQAVCATSSLAAMGVLGIALGPPVELQRLWNCGLAAAGGASDAISGVGTGIKKFFDDPEKFWQGTKEDAKQLWGFISNIRTEVEKLVKSLGGLDFETAMQIGCQVAGGILPGVIAGVLTGGAAAPLIARALPLLTLQVQRIGKMGPLLNVLSKQRLAGNLKNSDAVIDGVVSCAR